MNFRFVHAADLHIDSPLAGLGAKDAAVAERFARAGRESVDALVAATLEAKAAFLLIAGDVFDGDWRDVATGHFFVRAISRLHRAGVNTFLLHGNHDAESVLTRSLPYPDTVNIFPARKAETIELADLRVAIHGRSFPERGTPPDFVAKYPARREGWFNIGMLHTGLDGTRGHAGYAPCTIEDLKLFGYDYWALGHIHAREILHRDPWIVYSGNLQGRSVRETGPKGATLVHVEDGRVRDVEALTLDRARWAHVTVDASKCGVVDDVLREIEASLLAEHAAADGRPLAVRVTLSGETPVHGRLLVESDRLLQDGRSYAGALAENCWLEAVKIETRRPPARLHFETSEDSLDVAALIAAAAEDEGLAAALAREIEEIVGRLPRTLQETFARDRASARSLLADAGERLRERSTR